MQFDNFIGQRVTTELACECAKAPWMWLIGRRDLGTAIAGSSQPGQAHRLLDILFAHPKVDDLGAAFGFDFQHDIDCGTFFHGSDFIDALANQSRRG